MLLSDCKLTVDAGYTAKHQRYRSILYFLIRKKGEYYELQKEGYVNPDGIIIVQQETAFYETWKALLDALGWYASSSGWYITNDQFKEPPEKETASQDDQSKQTSP